MAEIKPIRIFTKEQPCTKVEIHNCFHSVGGYAPVPVVTMRGEIGLNVPKYLIKSGYARESVKGNIDYVALTPDGVEWLRVGLARFLVLHPERAAEVHSAPVRPPRPVRSVTPSKTATRAPAVSRRIVKPH